MVPEQNATDDMGTDRSAIELLSIEKKRLVKKRHMRKITDGKPLVSMKETMGNIEKGMNSSIDNTWKYEFIHLTADYHRDYDSFFKDMGYFKPKPKYFTVTLYSPLPSFVCASVSQKSLKKLIGKCLRGATVHKK